MKIRVLGVCAGNGVCLYPFKRIPKFEILGNIEPRQVFYDKTQFQWNLNFPGIPQAKKLELFRNPDIIIGHPDCGHSSILRCSRAKKNISAQGNVSVDLYFMAIQLHKPKIALMENLPGFLNTYSKEDLELQFPKYHIITHISSVMAYGNSQRTRERLVILFIKKNLDIRWRKIFRLPDYSDKAQFAEAFDLGLKEEPLFGHIREPLLKEANMIYGPYKKITYEHAKALWNTKYKFFSKWPVGGKMKNQPGVNKNLKGKYPFTVRKQNRQFNTRGDVLSPREMASIQGIPKSFKMEILPIPIQDKERIYWLNKWRTTVTKTMPYDIAKWFAKKSLKALTS